MRAHGHVSGGGVGRLSSVLFNPTPFRACFSVNIKLQTPITLPPDSFLSFRVVDGQLKFTRADGNPLLYFHFSAKNPLHFISNLELGVWAR